MGKWLFVTLTRAGSRKHSRRAKQPCHEAAVSRRTRGPNIIFKKKQLKKQIKTNNQIKQSEQTQLQKQSQVQVKANKFN